MRALTSVGFAAILVVIGALWLGTGLFVQGGLGPHDSEKTVVGLIEGEAGGPLTGAAHATGILRDIEHPEGAEDPSLSIADRNTLLADGSSTARSVRTRMFAVQAMPLEVTLRGHTISPATRDAVAQTADTVAKIFVTEGARVEAGDPICALSSGTRAAAVEQAKATVIQAEAVLEKARNEFNTNTALRESGIASPNSAEAFSTSLRLAEANLASAEIALTSRQDELAHTQLSATAAGVVQRPVAKIGDLIGIGGSCAKIVQLDPMRFVGAVPQSFVQHARIGLKATIRTINDLSAVGKITYVEVSADPATRSFDVEIEFPNPNGKILDGLTAEAHVTLGTVPAHLLPQSALTLASDGTLGVQIVLDGAAKFTPVEVLNDTPDGIWLSGLPADAEVIVIGQEYVTDGQSVETDRQG